MPSLQLTLEDLDAKPFNVVWHLPELTAEAVVPCVLGNRSKAFFCPACCKIWGRIEVQRTDYIRDWSVEERYCEEHGNGLSIKEHLSTFAPKEVLLRDLKILLNEPLITDIIAANNTRKHTTSTLLREGFDLRSKRFEEWQLWQLKGN